MNRRPFYDQTPGSWWQVPLDERQRFYVNDCFPPRIERMNMRGWVITEIHLDHDTVKRESSGMGVQVAQSGKDFFRTFPGKFHVKRVRAKVYLPRPFGMAGLCQEYLLENIGFQPSGENPATHKGRQIHFAASSVFVSKE